MCTNLYSTAVTGGRYTMCWVTLFFWDLRWSFLALLLRPEVMVNREKAAWSIPCYQIPIFILHTRRTLTVYLLFVITSALDWRASDTSMFAVKREYSPSST